MNAVEFLNMVEAHLLAYKSLGHEFVVVYRDKDAPEMMFVEPYRNYYDSTRQRKYWTNHGYVVKKFYDLDYLDWLEEQNV